MHSKYFDNVLPKTKFRSFLKPYWDQKLRDLHAVMRQRRRSLGGIIMYHIVNIKMLNANFGRNIENVQKNI